ncbi:MAG: 50S ribosomal protein L3 [Candidatus Omnitrophica bacterium]|nr:50S ribosomal protein L3 [Candidatus Omnitrophota bacterium]
MIRGILGKKIGMTQVFDTDGNTIPVTVVEAGPCRVLSLIEKPVKIKIGFEEKRESRVRKPELGLFKKAGVPAMRLVREISSTDNKNYQVGQEIKADIFKPGDYVDVCGISRGKGFQGGMVRWNWSGGEAAHGSMHHRRIGSAGSSAWPSRTFRGHHMPGHMGMDRVTVQGLRVIQVDPVNNLMLIKGAVPGHRNSFITVLLSKKKAFRTLGEVRATAEKSRNPMKQSKAKSGGKGK